MKPRIVATSGHNVMGDNRIYSQLLYMNVWDIWVCLSMFEHDGFPMPVWWGLFWTSGEAHELDKRMMLLRSSVMISPMFGTPYEQIQYKNSLDTLEAVFTVTS